MAPGRPPNPELFYRALQSLGLAFSIEITGCSPSKALDAFQAAEGLFGGRMCNAKIVLLLKQLGRHQEI